MQGVAVLDRELLDAESLVRHLVPAGSVYAFLADHRRVLFPDGLFADLFTSANGRPSVPADVVASVIVLQSLQGLSDREAIEALRCDLRWKVACGLALTDEGFHPTTLTYWRRRLAASTAPNRIFDAVRQVIAETGVLRGKTRRALDSTILDDAVATQDTVTQLIAAIRRVAGEVAGAAEVIVAECGAHDYTDPGKPRIAWDDAVARDRLVDALVGDARRLLDRLDAQAVDDAAAQALALLALVAGQDVEWVGDEQHRQGGSWRIAQRVVADRVVSTVDPESRHTHKTVHRRQDGFKAHVAVEPDTGIVTDCALTKTTGANNQEGVVGVRLLEHEQPGLQVLGDSAYGTGDARAALAEAGHQAVIKPPPLRSAVPGGYTVDDFIVDERAGTATCPAGVTRPINRTGRGLRGGLSRLPAAGSVHDRREGQDPAAAQARRVDACRTPAGRHCRLPGRLPAAPADGRAVDRVADPRQPQTPIPRRSQQRRMAAPPDCGAQPAPTHHPGPDPPGQGLGAGLTDTEPRTR